MISKNKLTAEKITKNYFENGKNNQILEKTSISFQTGKSYAITGASGSGKSTFLHILGGLDAPSSGKVMFNSQSLLEIQSENLELFRQKHLGFVFQFHYLLADLTILENIALPAIIAGMSTTVAYRKAENSLKQLNMATKTALFPHQLSGGQQQRVALLRAMINKPTFLLADEPTGNLDAVQAEHITQMMLKGKEEWNMGIILCTHDQKVADQMDYRLHLENGLLTQLKQEQPRIA